MKDFNNPELKRSSLVLVLLMVLTMAVLFLGLDLMASSIKNDYLDRMGQIGKLVTEREPALGPEVLSIISGENKEAGSEGAAFLKEYGLEKTTEKQFFPGIGKVYYQTILFVAFAVTGLGLLLLGLNYWQHQVTYHRLRMVITGARSIMDGRSDIKISEDMEGEYSRLAVAFNEMGEIIRENVAKLEHEKEFLETLLADISHQLKTPLTSMMIYNDIMAKGNLAPEKQAEFLENNLKQLERMNYLIKALLKLARLDSGTIALTLKKLDVGDTIRMAMDSLKSKADEAGVSMIMDVTDAQLVHDRIWLAEALTNILKNGIEHSPPGSSIGIHVEETAVFLRINIQDEGDGIDEKDLPNIFKRFYRAETSTKSDSVGIGLAISKSIVEQHEGMISASSEKGVGTRFEILFRR